MNLKNIFAFNQANAQVTLTKANSEPIIGETYKTNQIDTTNTLPMNVSGTGVTWNFSSVVLSTTVSAFTGSTSSNATYNPANIVVNANTGESSYYLSSANNLKYYGGNIIIAGNPANYTAWQYRRVCLLELEKQ